MASCPLKELNRKISYLISTRNLTLVFSKFSISIENNLKEKIKARFLLNDLHNRCNPCTVIGICRLKNKFQSPLGASIKQLISDPAIYKLFLCCNYFYFFLLQNKKNACCCCCCSSTLHYEMQHLLNGEDY